MYANKTGFHIRKCSFMQQIVLKAAAEEEIYYVYFKFSCT